MIRVIQGDCRAVLKTLPENSVDAIVTDPPYHLTQASRGGHARTNNPESPHGRHRIGDKGFMGKQWDGGDVAFQPATWVEAVRVLKPGGFLVAFGGTRTYHRLVCAIEDAGFEVRDMLAWLYGSGFPKGTDKAKIPHEWAGWNTALKPAIEPICLARKPMDGTLAENLQRWSTGALWIDGCRIETDDDLNGGAYAEQGGRAVSQSLNASGMNVPGKTTGEEFVQPPGRWPANVLHDGSDEVLANFPDAPGQIASASASARKSQNVYGAMKRGNGREGEPSADSQNDGSVGFKMKPGARRGDEGSAARFFYCPKADRADRNEGVADPGPQFKYGSTLRDAENVGAQRRGNYHPTVKPTDLMRWLVRLVTPPGGQVLDPFLGSGSTLKAAELEGFSGIGIELSPEYVDIASRRISGDAPLFASTEVRA